jgi:hypothetical protein
MIEYPGTCRRIGWSVSDRKKWGRSPGADNVGALPVRLLRMNINADGKVRLGEADSETTI